MSRVLGRDLAGVCQNMAVLSNMHFKKQTNKQQKKKNAMLKLNNSYILNTFFFPQFDLLNLVCPWAKTNVSYFRW